MRNNVLICVTFALVGSLVFKEMTVPRHIDSLESDCYHTTAVYKCGQGQKLPGCGKVLRMTDEEAVQESEAFPRELFFLLPVHLFSQCGWTVSLMEAMFNLVSSQAGVADFIAMVRKSRVTTYLLAAQSYQLHVDFYLNRCRENCFAASSEGDQPKDFPSFFCHCNGYNGTLGPSARKATSLFIELVEQQRPFLIGLKVLTR
jgi:hypothetical protein